MEIIWISIRFNQVTDIREWYNRNSLKNVCYKVAPNNLKKCKSSIKVKILIFTPIEYRNRCEPQLTITGDTVAKF
jgi:hypothetical protein